MSEQVQEQVKKSTNKAPKVETQKEGEAGQGRVEKVEHQSGDFTIEHR